MTVTLEVTDGPGKGRSFDLSIAGAYLVGRSPRCNFAVGSDTKCSRVHLVVDFSPPVCRIRDLGSKHGTFVNGELVYEAELADGDRVLVGATTLTARIGQPAAMPAEPESVDSYEAPPLEAGETAPEVSPSEASSADAAEPAESESVEPKVAQAEPPPAEPEQPQESPKKPRARKKKPSPDEDAPPDADSSGEIIVFLDPPDGTDG